MLRIALALAGVALMTACASVPPPSPAVRTDLAPTGKLRAGINYGNMILAQKDPATGESRGPAIDRHEHDLRRGAGGLQTARRRDLGS